MTTSTIATYRVDPESSLDYGMDWATWLASGDTLTTSTWTIYPTGPTLFNSTSDTTTTTVWVEGCVAGTDYLLTNHIVTTDGREDDRSVCLRCVHR